MTIKIVYKDMGTRLSDNGYTLTEEEQIYDLQLQDIIDNPRVYLDALDHMAEYRVSWKNYKSGLQITPPYKFVNQEKNKNIRKKQKAL